MVYTSNKQIEDLEALTSPATDDVLVLGDTSDSGRAKQITWANVKSTIEGFTSYFNKTTAVLDDISNVNAPSPTDGQLLVYETASSSWKPNTSSTPDASTTVAGKFEEATSAEVNAGTATGGTGSRLAVSTAALAASNYATYLPSSGQKDALVGTGTPSSSNKYVTNDTLTTTAATKANALDAQTFTSSGTWTKPAAATADSVVIVEAWGAGGGGGGAVTGTSRGSGGGGGGYVKRIFRASQLSSTETVTIGAGGAGGAGAVAGSVGGNSTFGSKVTAYGGGGGYFANNSTANSGGGGGGISSAGSTGSTTTSGAGGGYGGGASSGSVPTQDTGGASGGVDVAAINGFAAMNSNGGGGGAAGGTGGVGGNALYGGGGGGSNGNAGGTSTFGGNGGAGGSANSNGTAGSAPAGGGGGANTSSGSSFTGGAGGRGEIRVITIF